MKKILCKIIVTVFAATLVFGCAKINTTYTDANKEVAKTQQEIAADKIAADQIADPAISKQNFYSDTKPLTAEQKAYWLKNTISIEAHGVPFSFLVAKILRNVSVAIKYDPVVKKVQLLSMNYNGTVQGALDELSDRTGYAYVITDDGILWVDMVTKTFNIAFMPGTSNYLVGGTNNNNGNTATSTSGSATSSTINNGGISDTQYSSMQGTLSLWDDLKNTLDQLKSKDGKISVSQSTTSVTVSDHPSNVAAMERYINQLNQEMGKQVKLKVQVLEMQLDKDHQYGIDWNATRSLLNTHFSLASSAVKLASAASDPMSLTIGRDSHAIIKALSSQGKVSIVTEPTVNTMNNQIAEIRISRDTGYLQSVSQTMTGGNSNFVTTSLTPGTVSDGFVLYLLPKLQDNQIYLQISSTLSTLVDLKAVSSVTGAVGGQNNQTQTQIFVPTMQQKKFNMRSLLANGETLVIAGFKQARNETQANGPFGVKLLGGEAAQTNNAETIILITPIIEEK